ncbi:MAG TPA: FkbM family methyltransferase [Mycobacteriales bacterium]|nr:FkbM family methyltransferase [Mycobacteriales bacterium]HWA65756.1 FkbM family methyltransferase [Mycobacteriales bacterium]
MFAASAQAALISGAAALTERASYRGLRRVAWGLGHVFPSDNRVVVARPDGKLWLYLNDGYWSPLLRPHWAYEPEVGRALERLLRPDSYFIDGGANIGYWSMFASARLPAGSVVAVEAAPQSYQRLAENAELNDDRWRCVYAALWNVADETLTMHASRRFHASGTVVERIAFRTSLTSTISTVTVDELVARYASDTAREIVIKLDVEGAELPAIEGATETLRRRAWHLVYEDHGKDPTHAVTRFLMGELGLRVHALAGDGSFAQVSRLDALDEIKKDPRKGYNFVASSQDLAPRLGRDD